MTRTLILGATLFAVAVAAAPSIADEREEAAEQQSPPARSIQPTDAELAAFQLPRPEVIERLDPPSLAFEASGWGMIAASAADVATTELGLSQGLAEANPIASSRTARVIHHVVGPAAVWYTTEKLRQSGKKKLALSLRIALMAAYSYAAFHNSQQIGSASVTP